MSTSKPMEESKQADCDNSSNSTLSLKCVAELVGHRDRVWCCDWAPNGAALATSSGDSTVRIWAPVSDSDDSKWECKAILDGVSAYKFFQSSE
jgi:WD40 repeat protein